MEERRFVDHYEVLQLNQNADAETVERVYRILAKRFHPDNAGTGDDERFRRVREAYEVLSDPERRAKFDVRYDEQRGLRWQIFEQNTALDSQAQDLRIFNGMLSLLYAARRRDPESGGLGSIQVEEMLGVPREHLEFPIWYLKQKGLIETLQSGELAITIKGIDSLQSKAMALPDNRLIEQETGGGGDLPDEPTVRYVEGPEARGAAATG